VSCEGSKGLGLTVTLDAARRGCVEYGRGCVREGRGCVRDIRHEAL